MKKQCVISCLYFFLAMTPFSLMASPLIQSANAIQGDGLDNRSLVRVNGLGFGDKKQGPPILFDQTSKVYENGVKNTFQGTLAESEGIPRISVDQNSLWAKPSTYTSSYVFQSSSKLRHSNLDRQYSFPGPNSFLGWPRAYGGEITPPSNDVLYVSWWYRTAIEHTKYTEVAYSMVSGSFVETNGTYSEDLIFEGRDDLSGYVIGESDGKLALYAEKNTGAGVGSTDLLNLKVRGKVSGAVAILDPDSYLVAWGGASKFIRIWEEITGKDGFRLSWTHDMLGVTDVNGSTIRDQMDTVLEAGLWHHMEILVDLDSNIVKRWVNSKPMNDLSIDNARRIEGASPTIALIGLNGKQTFNKAEISDIYMDSTPQRVMLANASNWEAVTHTELQRVIDWSPSNVSFELVYGSLDSGSEVYLYIVDEYGKVNSSGFKFRLSNPPVPPKLGVSVQ